MPTIPTITLRAARRALAALAGLLALAPAAHAGSYTVTACQSDGVNNSFGALASNGMAAYPSCPGIDYQGPTTGLVTRASVPPGGTAGSVSYHSAAIETFYAPAGATLASMSFKASAGRRDNTWGYGVVGYSDSSDFWSAPLLWGTAPGGAQGGAGITYFVGPYSVNLTGRSKVAFETVCGGAGGCSTSAFNGNPAAWMTGEDVSVVVSDSTLPSITATGGALWDSGWHRGSESVTFNANDNTGIKATSLTVDANPIPGGLDSSVCDYTFAAPCPNVAGRTRSIDTTQLTDGQHAVGLGALDTANNASATLTNTIAIDNHAPGRPANVTVSGGEGWRQTNNFTITWDNPAGQTAPISAAHYQLCPTGDPGNCTTGTQSANGIATLTGVSVRAPGDYTLKLSLEDQAGNSDSSSTSDPVHLRFDNVPPGQAELATLDGWLNAAQATAGYDQHIAMRTAATVPVSGIAGYSITTDGSDPDNTIDLPTPNGDYRLHDLPEGTTTVKATAISGAGVPSTQADQTPVRVDKTPPSTSIAGAPDPQVWQRAPVTLTVTGTDQANLSGMAAAATDQPLEHGGYIAYRVDSGAPLKARGNTATIAVATDGAHTLTYQAFDAAGNPSAERTARFKLDQTPPETAAFEPQDPSDPRQLSVVVEDRTSGVAGGVIELRRKGTDAWRALDTTFANDRLTAQIPDTELDDGTYQLRARVRDVAGNEQLGDRFANGSPATFALPLRLATRITATATTSACITTRSTLTRSRRRARRRACSTTTSGNAIRVPFVKTAVVHGLLETYQGRPVARTTVQVSERPRTKSTFTPLGAIRTDSDGRFTYTIPAGPSRIVRFAYAGNETIKPTTSDLGVLVPALSTLSVNRRSALNGHSVLFTGRLLGGSIPSGGRVIALQAYYRGKWRTFATPRTDGAGSWRYRYRFGATGGRVTYRFRAVIQREADHPYETGYSPEIAVTVRGH